MIELYKIIAPVVKRISFVASDHALGVRIPPGAKYMNKRVFIVHGWEGHPNEGWFPWLKKELEARGFEVCVPQLPDSKNPRIYNWVPALAKTVGATDENTYFVGHSMGCQAIARYIETLPQNIQIGGAIFVGGFFKHLTGLEDRADVQETDRHWLQAPINFEKIKSHLPQCVAIFSDNDQWVPLDNQNDFRDKLSCEISIEHNMHHFNDEAGIRELPVVLESILKIAS